MKNGSMFRLVRPVVLFTALAFGLVAVACDGGCGDKMPSKPGERVEDMSSHLPSDAQMSVVISDLERMRASLESARDTIGDTLPMADLAEEQAETELGIDLFDEESWKDSGIAPDGAMTITALGEYPVMLTYVKDQQKFEKHLSEQLQDRFDTDAATKTETIDGTKVKYLGDEEGDQTAAWALDGQLAIVALPAVEEAEEVNDEEVAENEKEVVAELISLEKDDSLASHGSLENFNSGLAEEHAIAVFLNNTELLTDERVEQFQQDAPTGLGPVLDWTQQNVRASGFGLDVDGNAVSLRGWSDVPKEVRERLESVLKAPAKADMEGYATENTLAALRASVDMSELWKLYKETAPEEDQAQVEQLLGAQFAQTDLDFEEDVIGKMTGNLGLYLYGLSPSAIQKGPQVMEDLMMQPMKSVALILPLQFEDAESRDAVIEALQELDQTGAEFERETVEGDVEVIKNKAGDGSQGQFYVADDMLVFASGVFDEESVYEYIAGEREEPNLTEVDELDLGAELAEGDDYDGLYLNFVRARNHLGEVLTNTAPQALTILEKFEEAAVTTGVESDGAHVDLRVDLTPGEGDDAEGDDGQEE
ncbi:MAG: DUF3352 domain-containing protein [Persicimonas sp.]